VLSDAHVRLGDMLRSTREQAGRTTRNVPKPGRPAAFYSTGHISQVEAGVTAPSPELVEVYASMTADAAPLHAAFEQMRASTQRAARTRRADGALEGPPGPPRSVKEVNDRRDVQRHYVVISHDADYRFAETGSISDVRCSASIRAKDEGVVLYYAGFSYPADQRPGALTVTAVAGGDVAEARESGSGAVAAYFRLSRELSPSDPDAHRLTYRVDVASTARAAPRLRYFATADAEALGLSAAFPTECAPLLLWWFAASDVVDVEHPVPGREIAPGADGAYRHRFERLVPGWCYGFAWVW